MPRIRTVKPDFWKSESIAVLPFRARLFFIGLWTYVDDNGVGLDNFKLIAAELFGLEEDPREARNNVREDLARLHAAGRIVRYTVNGKRYLAVVNWNEHQKIDRPGKARYPGPEDPGAQHLSSENAGQADEPETAFATPSREPRETLAPGIGKKEQGKEEQGELLPPPPPPVRTPAPGADDDPNWCKFWDAYPLKVSKKEARTRYAAAVQKGAKPEDIIAGAESYRDRVRREGIPRDKTKHPDGWLSGERWNDEMDMGDAQPRNAAAHDLQGRGSSELARRAPIPRSPADQRVADNQDLYQRYRKLEEAQHG
ncbi:hypothetical protein ACWT_5698 [Actinoplanes sp. SE50]|uniref:hypothetical protein n=1 Tax=unclassified Actinoplanes TaxID=2626549 RepID=UPI00023ED2E1|nr:MULTISPECIES: hypothetical protein [unclassified Actinoplanes]AEV86715.1 hypothetical protein ACPL_5828 [Actinoplanes sp. SE50/110]ATO85113.1 hypothetical protein ACWT_5698 [Actinoplanes sp. SE50]SLM02524.1 hypothetical protein ACSP50_5774 [Actinoplanes sp. SE50/110]